MIFNDRLTVKIKQFLLMGITAVVYYVTARAGLLLAFETTHATAVWPPSGIALALMILLGYRIAPGIFIGAFTANLVEFLSHPSGNLMLFILSSSFIAAGNTLEAFAGTYCYRRIFKENFFLTRIEDTFKFIFIATGVCLISALIGPTSFCLLKLAPWSHYTTILSTWWLGDMTGILLFTPFLLTWAQKNKIQWEARWLIEGMILISLMFFTIQIGFGLWTASPATDFPLAFLTLPLLIWIALRFGPNETTTVMIFVAGLTIFETIHGAGPFVRETAHESLLFLQSFVGILAMTILMMTAAVNEKRTVAAELEKSKKLLETHVDERTSELADAILELEKEVHFRKQTENTLRQREEHFRSLIENALDIITVLDNIGTIKYESPSTERVLGYPMGELLGKNVFEFLHPNDLPKVLHIFTKGVFIPNFTSSLEFRFRHKNGTWCYLESIGQNLLHHPTVKGIVVNSRDITLRRQAEKELLEKTTELAHAKAEKDQMELFTYVASHDLQEPLQKIISFSELLKKKEAAHLDSESQDFLTRIMKASLRISRLIDDLLKFSRITAGLDKMTTTKINLNNLIQDTQADLEVRIRESNANINVSPLPEIDGNPSQLQQLFLNLISNAIKFRKKDQAPDITIQSRLLNNGRIEISITDKGIGFEPNMSRKIFKPFERLHARNLYEGSGLGLAICEKIALNHGGCIKAEGTPGQGSVFTVELPLKPSGTKV